MYAKDLPKTEQELSAWALEYSPDFSWKDLEDHDDIVLNTNIIIDWVCKIAVKYPDAITLDYTKRKSPRVKIAGIKVCGGLIPMILIKRFIEENEITVKTVGKHTDLIEVKFD